MSSAISLRALLIDNYDSYTYNLFQLLYTTSGLRPFVFQNDSPWNEIEEILPMIDFVVISPGPGRPEVEKDFGVCRKLLEGGYQVLGVCLGLQGLAYVNGGKIVHAEKPMHGQISKINVLGNCEMFHGFPEFFDAVRYNSLVVAYPVPDSLVVTAVAENGEIMGLSHKTFPIHTVQFHPESQCTQFGKELINNFMNRICTKRRSCDDEPRIYGINEILNPSINLRVQIEHLEWENPETLFSKNYCYKKDSFWLDSSRVEKGLSRFSYMGCLEASPISARIQYYSSCRVCQIFYPFSNSYRTFYIPLTSDFSIFLSSYMGQYCISKGTDLEFGFMGGLVGYYGYEMMEPVFEFPRDKDFDYPDSTFFFIDRFTVFDHELGTCMKISLCQNNEIYSSQEVEPILSSIKTDQIVNNFDQGNKLSFSMRLNENEYIDAINKCKSYIKDGESYEMCLTNQFTLNESIAPFELYKSLRKLNPVPYAAFLSFTYDKQFEKPGFDIRKSGSLKNELYCTAQEFDYFGSQIFDDLSVVCSSPERFFRLENRIVDSKPIKGTLPRGTNLVEDEMLKMKLANSKKDFAENLMIVDLIRNDLGRICLPGSVQVLKLMSVESYATVHQLVSSISGILNDSEKDAGDVIRAMFPPGSMTGAPKLRTTMLLHDLEKRKRGIYSGCLGYWSLSSNADFCVVIRTAVVKPNSITIGAGGAIVDPSVPQEEYEEMMLKTKSVISALIKVKNVEGFDSVLFDGVKKNFTKPATII